MDELIANVLTYLEGARGPLAYLLLVAAAALEYLFPPFPGDTVILFGAFLAATADYRPTTVYLLVTFGSIAGGMAAYAFGRLFDDESRWPKWLQTPRARWAFAILRDRFDRYGSMYIAINRFVPAMRAFFFVAAGVARMPAGRVLLFGTLSAGLWNALILAVGYTVGKNWDRLLELSHQYTIGTLVVLALVIAGIVVRYRLRRSKR